MPANERVFLLVSLMFVFFAFFPKTVLSYSNSFFSDNVINTANWQIYENTGKVTLSSGALSLYRSDTVSNSFPYLYTTDEVFPISEPFSINIRFKFLNTGNFGDGITISPGAVPANESNPDNNLFNYMIFMIYQDKNNGLSYGKFICDQDGSNCTQRTFLHPFTHASDLAIHDVKIVFNENSQYLIYIDDESTPVYISGVNQRRPKKIWIGNSFKTGSVDFWSSLKIDYIRVSSLLRSRPVIILPGFGGSWDLTAVITGTKGSNWKVPKQITVYDGILNSLKESGYEEGKNMFLFSYDWRKPISDLAEDLKDFIEEKGLSEEKIDIVGHSMGGLIARTYAQTYGTEKINKIVTAGTPHEGTVDAYGLWEGGVFWGNVWWEKALLSLTTELNHLPKERKIDTLRRVAPSIKDILPTEDFIFRDGSVQPWENLNQKNQFLKDLNDNSNLVSSLLAPLWSGDEQTRDLLNTRKRTLVDVLRGLWEDGRPIKNDPFVMQNGDGTVTESSAVGNFSGKSIVGSGNHISLISSEGNIVKILKALDIKSDNVSSSNIDYPSSVFLAALRSPGRLEVCNWTLDRCDDGLGQYFSDSKLFMLPGYNKDKLRLRVYANGEMGKYSLHLGNVDMQDNWERVDGNLKRENQVDTYYIKNGSYRPKSRDDCKRDGWKSYHDPIFKNQGQCVSEVEKGEKEIDH